MRPIIKNTADILTYDRRTPQDLPMKAAFSDLSNGSGRIALPTLSIIKHSNGGCAGFKPASLRSDAPLYSANNFSNRIFPITVQLRILYHTISHIARVFYRKSERYT